MIRIFLAHASEDKAAVTQLYQRLKKSGFQPWLDKVDLLPGQSWRAEIPKAIKNSQVFIACLSQKSVQKQGYVQREFRMALNVMADRPPGQIYLIPVRLDDCQIPELRQEEYGISLTDYQWVNLYEPDGYDRLVQGIRVGFADILTKTEAPVSSSARPKQVPTSPPEAPVSSSARPKQVPTSPRQSQRQVFSAPVRTTSPYSRGDRVSRRKLTQILALSGGSIGTILFGRALFQRDSSTSDTFPDARLLTADDFTKTSIQVVTVNEKGEKVSEESLDSYVFEESVGDITLDLVLIEGGSFLMGSPDSESYRHDQEGPQHEVTVQSFLMGRYEVTQAQWKEVAGMSKVDRDLDPDPSFFKGDTLPVEKVSWDDAVEFCQRLSENTGRKYRLPSEAEWEYACRAGTTTPYHFGPTITPELANYLTTDAYNSGPKGKPRRQTTDVRSFPANSFGLYDMHGNVMEWCQDHWHKNYNGAPNDGSAWIEGGDSSLRVLRGGAWLVHPANCRSASRDRGDSSHHDNSRIGFRVVCASSLIDLSSPL